MRLKDGYYYIEAGQGIIFEAYQEFLRERGITGLSSTKSLESHYKVNGLSFIIEDGRIKDNRINGYSDLMWYRQEPHYTELKFDEFLSLLPPRTKTVQVGNQVATVSRDTVTVGCTTVPAEFVLAVADAIKELRQ